MNNVLNRCTVIGSIRDERLIVIIPVYRYSLSYYPVRHLFKRFYDSVQRDPTLIDWFKYPLKTMTLFNQ